MPDKWTLDTDKWRRARSGTQQEVEEVKNDMPAQKPWQGRFTEATDRLVESFTASVQFDRRLYRQDIAGSIAHAQMLTHVGVLTAAECKAIVAGLKQIETEIDDGQFAWRVELEDVHMNIESVLTARIGEAGKKLHTARSRNDQVATTLRLYVREQIDTLAIAILALQTALVDVAEREAATVMPGFTHLQIAQPITFGHHLLAWVEMLERDYARLKDARQRVNVMPLGSAALAGTSYPIDREFTAKALGFDAPSENSVDSVSDRDFAIETVSALATLMMHLSRFSEEIILWSTTQFGFVELSDGFCTGSSIMPQKKNPDVPELIRGKAARVQGHLMTLLTLMKGQPLAYNKDNQEDKEPLFDAFDTALASVQIYREMVAAMTVNRARMQQQAAQGFSTATDLADYLVRRGVAFRDAHEVVGKAVRFGIEQGRDLAQLTLDELKKFSPHVDKDVFAALTLAGSVAARNHIGGTAVPQVHAAIARARARLQRHAS